MFSYTTPIFILCSKLKAGRACFQDLVSKHSSEVDEVTVAFIEYAGLLRGLVDAPEGGDSKLRGLTSFKWTSSCLGRTPRLGTHELVCVCILSLY